MDSNENNRDAIQEVIDSTDGWLCKYGTASLDNLGLSVAVYNQRHGAGVCLNFAGNMTAQRAAALIAALRNLDI